MKRLRIVGGGMTGILAALRAHDMGVPEVVLHERLDTLGGVALPQLDPKGRELREGCIYFGPPASEMRALLEAHGARFEDVPNEFGSVSPAAAGTFSLRDFGGPAFEGHGLPLKRPADDSLDARLSAYPDTISGPAMRYAEWHLGCDLAKVHESAAIPLAINRVFPRAAEIEELATAKKREPLADELLAIPRTLWGRTENLVASLPVGGFVALFEHLRGQMLSLGIEIRPRDLVRPAVVLDDLPEDEVLLWAASPTPLFKAAGVKAPKFLAKRFATYVFEAEWDGPLPFYAQNFTAEGVCFRAYLYESAGGTLLTAECVETNEESVEEDVASLLSGFGKVTVGERLLRTVKPRWIYHTTETIDRLADVRRILGERHGPSFIAGAWEAYAKDPKFHEVNAALDAAFGGA